MSRYILKAVKKFPGQIGIGEHVSNAFSVDGDWRICREEIAWDLQEEDDGILYFGFNVDRLKVIAKNRLGRNKKRTAETRAVLNAFLESKPNNKDIARNVAIFIRLVERRLGIKRDKITRIQRTDRDNVIYIKLSRFWLNYNLRMSLFTILLRAGLYFTEGSNFESTLFMNRYARETMFACIRFFQGYNIPKKDHEGWHDLFSELITSEILERLTRSKSKKSKSAKQQTLKF